RGSWRDADCSAGTYACSLLNSRGVPEVHTTRTSRPCGGPCVPAAAGTSWNIARSAAPPRTVWCESRAEIRFLCTTARTDTDVSTKKIRVKLPQVKSTMPLRHAHAGVFHEPRGLWKTSVHRLRITHTGT